MKYIFISGIPASGKSYLAKKVAKATGVLHFKIDDWREEFWKNENADWVDFFWNKNEKEYWETITPQKHWNNLKNQSEAVWPIILEKIRTIQKTKKSAIFESVNILPHLARRDFDFPGIVLLGESIDTIFERCKKDPRWGKTEELQKIEAEWFFIHEGKIYEKEAKKYGYKTFRDSDKAEKELIKLLKNK